MPLALFVAFLVVPVAEIYVIIQVGGLIGVWPTVALLLTVSIVGAWVVRREGLRAWTKLRRTLNEGRMPDRELANAALILIGGTLLLTPGFVTDATGLVFVLPPSRALIRRGMVTWFKRRVRKMEERAVQHAQASGYWQQPQQGHVVRGEVVDDNATDESHPGRRDTT